MVGFIFIILPLDLIYKPFGMVLSCSSPTRTPDLLNISAKYHNTLLKYLLYRSMYIVEQVNNQTNDYVVAITAELQVGSWSVSKSSRERIQVHCE
jgi:hypothetical protein